MGDGQAAEWDAVPGNIAKRSRYERTKNFLFIMHIVMPLASEVSSCQISDITRLAGDLLSCGGTGPPPGRPVQVQLISQATRNPPQFYIRRGDAKAS